MPFDWQTSDGLFLAASVVLLAITLFHFFRAQTETNTARYQRHIATGLFFLTMLVSTANALGR